MKRRLPSGNSPSEPIIQFDSSEAEKMITVSKDLAGLVKSFYNLSRSALAQAGLQSDPEAGVPPAKLLELLNQAIDQIYSEINESGVEIVRVTLAESVNSVNEMNKV
jgi:hypothetical protein